MVTSFTHTEYSVRVLGLFMVRKNLPNLQRKMTWPIAGGHAMRN